MARRQTVVTDTVTHMTPNFPKFKQTLTELFSYEVSLG